MHFTILTFFNFCRPVNVYRFLSEETIEEGIHTIAQDKLKLEQDLAASEGYSEDETKRRSCNKKDIKRLLKIALDVELSEKELGDVEKVQEEL